LKFILIRIENPLVTDTEAEVEAEREVTDIIPDEAIRDPIVDPGAITIKD
jgi:hypothetical protein